MLRVMNRAQPERLVSPSRLEASKLGDPMMRDKHHLSGSNSFVREPHQNRAFNCCPGYSVQYGTGETGWVVLPDGLGRWVLWFVCPPRDFRIRPLAW